MYRLPQDAGRCQEFDTIRSSTAKDQNTNSAAGSNDGNGGVPQSKTG